MSMNKKDAAIISTLRGESRGVEIWWDDSDPISVGPAYRFGPDGDSGPLDFIRWARIDGKAVSPEEAADYRLEDWFLGPDGAYSGPDEDGVYPILG